MAITVADWETALVRQYLRADGPHGNGPLRFIDASSEEVARAVGRPISDAETVLRLFLASFGSISAVRDVLTHGYRPSLREAEGPGWFRHLVLTCLVAASEDLAEEGDFRERMRSLFGWPSAIVHLNALPSLWRDLAGWCEERRRAGDPYRRVILPPRGWMQQIGESVRIAFPSRLDRLRFYGLVRDMTGDLRNVADVIRLVAPRLDTMPWSDGFRAAFDDFARRYRRGDRLLIDHAFWQLFGAARAAARKDDEFDEDRTALRLAVEYDETVLLELTATTPSEGTRPVEVADGTILHVRTGRPAAMLASILAETPGRGSISARIAASADLGVLPFVERGWGLWTYEPEIDSGPVRVLASARLRARLPRDTGWSEVDGGWLLSATMAIGAYEALLQQLGSPVLPLGALHRAYPTGGIRIGSVFLGRPDFLPSIEASPGVDAAVISARSRLGNLGLTCDRAGIRLEASEPLDGVWRIGIGEDADAGWEAELSLAFIPHALEHDVVEIGDRPGWDPDSEARGEPGRPLPIQSPIDSRPTPQRMLDLLEAVYAGGRTGWATTDLIATIERVSRPGGPRVWDVIRSLREGGWLDFGHAVRWGATRWFLRRASVVKLSPDLSVLDGAACETTRERFRSIAGLLGGVTSERAGVGDWAVPTLVSTGVAPETLANELGLAVAEHVPIRLRPAPACWSPSIHGVAGRLVDTRWDWDAGRFTRLPAEERDSVVLERLVRANGDARDIYMVSARDSPPLVLQSRTAAIVEAHRLRHVSLFAHSGALLVRLRKDGFLPSDLARTFRLRHLLAPGPVSNREAGFTYAYPCSAEEARELARLFGAAIEVPGSLSAAVDHGLSRRLGPRGRALLNQRHPPTLAFAPSRQSDNRS